MKTLKTLLVALAVWATGGAAHAQDPAAVARLEPFFTPPDSMLARARTALQNQNAEEALLWLSHIPPQLPQYTEALWMRANLYPEVGLLDSAAWAYHRLLTRQSEYTHEVYSRLADVYEDLRQLDKSEAVLREGYGRFPHSYILAYQLGILLSDTDRLDSSLVWFRRALHIYPFHQPSHLAIGQVAHHQGRLVEAAAALATGIVMAPTNELSLGALLVLEEVVADWRSRRGEWRTTDGRTYPLRDLLSNAHLDLAPTPTLAYPQELWPMRLIDNLLALSDTIAEWDTNPEWEMYGPFFRGIPAQNHQPALLHLMMTTVDHPAVQQYLSTNEGAIENLMDQVTDYWQSNFMTINLPKPDTTLPLPTWFDPDGMPEGAGFLFGETAMGEWVFFYPNFALRSMGRFDRSGLKTGIWTYYDSTGTLANQEEYREGGLEQVVLEYYPNGRPRSRYVMRRDEVNGPVQDYYPNGALRAEYRYADNRRNGPMAAYFPDGTLQTQATYEADELQGRVVRYHPHGTLESVGHFDHGRETGPFTAYGSRGEIRIQGQYFEGNREGPWTFYGPDSILTEVIHYHIGHPHGPHREFFPDGTLRRESAYENGVLSGITLEYDRQGRRIGRWMFNQGLLREYAFYDSTGAILGQRSVETGTFHYARTAPSGVVLEEGDQLSGQRLGIWKTRYCHGIDHEWIPHENGNITGEVRRFFPDGTLQSTEQHAADLPNGILVAYHPNGKLSEVVQQENGQKDGYRLAFFSNGQWQAQEHYRLDTLFGPQWYYFVNGQPQRLDVLSDTGHVIVLFRLNDPTLRDTIVTQLGTQPFTHRFAGGQAQAQGQLINGLRDGTFQYFDNQGRATGQENFTQDEPHGYFRLNLPGSAVPYQDGHYFRGEPDSTWRWFHPNGALARVGNYRFGQAHGPWMVKDTAGRVLEIQRFEYGEAHGMWEWRSPDGLPLAALNFTGSEVTHWPTLAPGIRVVADSAFRHATGALQWRDSLNRKLAHVELVAGTLHGHFWLFYPHTEASPADTNLIFRRMGFHFGKPHGIWQDFWPNGQLATTREYQHGQETGLWRWFDVNGKLTRSERYECGYRQGPLQLYHPGEPLPHTVIHFLQDIPTGASLPQTQP